MNSDARNYQKLEKEFEVYQGHPIADCYQTFISEELPDAIETMGIAGVKQALAAHAHYCLDRARLRQAQEAIGLNHPISVRNLVSNSVQELELEAARAWSAARELSTFLD